MEWKPEEHQQCSKMLELVGSGKMQCIQPTLANNPFRREHQPTAEGKPQKSGWTQEQIEAARVCCGIIIKNDRIVAQAATA